MPFWLEIVRPVGATLPEGFDPKAAGVTFT
jgi:hypothetical protein